jgi:hypothetical protein
MWYYIITSSSVGIAMGYGIDGWGSIPGRGNRLFLFSTASKRALGYTQPPVQWVSGVKLPGLADVKNAGATPPLNSVALD